MTRRWLLALPLGLAACRAPLPDTIAIAGATLLDGNERVIPYSIVLVRDGRIAAVGPQADVPLPKTAATADGLGRFLVMPAADGPVPQGAFPLGRVTVGRRATLLLLRADPRRGPEAFSQVDRLMVDGAWREAR